MPALNHYYAVDALQENIARDYLANNEDTAYLTEGESELALVEIKHGLASHVTRFQQTIAGVPVVDAYVTTVQGPTGEFVAMHDQGHSGLVTQSGEVLIDFAGSEAAALAYAGAERTFAESRGELAWLPAENKTADQVWQITVYGVTPEEHGDFYTFVNPTTGEVISQENRIANFEDGSGHVYYANPYQQNGSGTGIADGNDADSPGLMAQEVNVTLQGLDEGTGLLTGEFVDLATLNGDFDVDANEPTRVYDYHRNDKRFEQVTIYHTVDQLNRYFHTLGFDDDSGTPNGIRDFPTLASAHWDSADQSFYSTGDDAIHFGDGGVDDGEDPDIIAHEYGHAIQNNQNSAWGGGEMGAMGEGFGDYLAASFFQDEGDAAFQALHAAAVGEWDATSYSSDAPPNLRRVDGNKTYADLVGQVHADGEIWSRALWDINQDIGASLADQMVLEAHFLMPANSSMVDGAEAILLADRNLNGGLYEANIRTSFEARGILEAPPTIGTVGFDSSVYGVGDPVEVTVVDANASTPVMATVTTSAGDSEDLVLSGSGTVYTITVGTAAGAVTAGDGTLQVALGDSITVSYFDADDGNGGSFTTTDTANIANVTQYTATDTPLDIPDNNATGITSTITIADAGTLIDVDMQLDITHTYDGDLDATLTAPDGSTYTIFDRIGGSGDNYDNTYFDDNASDSINSGSAPFTGTFRPNEAFTPLNGVSMTGDWTLTIIDNAGIDIGSLNSWSLFLTVETTSTGTDVGPLGDSDTAANEVSEGVAVGTAVGVTAFASDPDSGDTVTYSLSLGSDPTAPFAVDSATGVVTVSGFVDYEAETSYTIDVVANSSDGSSSSMSFDIDILNVDDAVVSESLLYYAGSSYSTSDRFDAVSTDKQPLLPGQTATFANYTSYSLGINGVALEVNDFNVTPTLANVASFFEFNVGNNNTTSGWASAPVPTEVIFENDVDGLGTDRVFLTWADNAIQNQWLEVNVLANSSTGMAAPSVFYYGNQIGETGNDSANARVNLIDVGLARSNQTGFTPAAIDNAYDFNRDTRVNLVDVAIARSNQTGFTSLALITPPASRAAADGSKVADNSSIVSFARNDSGVANLDSAFASQQADSLFSATQSDLELAGAIAPSDVAKAESTHADSFCVRQDDASGAVDTAFDELELLVR